jgi:hypothetical protein
MKRIIMTLMVMFGILSQAALGFQLTDRSVARQNLIVLFDISQDVVSCPLILKKNISAVKDLLSEESLRRGHIGKVAIFLFRKDIVGETSVDSPSKGRIHWNKISEKSLKAFKELFEASYDPKTTELADVFGAIEKAIGYADSLKHKSILVVVSPGVQEYNRVGIKKEIRLRVPEKVRKVIFLSQPFACEKVSAALKYQYFQKYVLQYWNSVLEGEKTEIHYSY